MWVSAITWVLTGNFFVYPITFRNTTFWQHELGLVQYNPKYAVYTLLCWRTASSSAMYFSVPLGGFIVQYRVGKSTRSCLEVSAFLGRLQYSCVLIHQWWNTHYIYSPYIYYLLVDGIFFTCISKPCCWVGAQQIHEVKKLLIIEQVSRGIHPEVHSQRIQGPQGPDPPAFPYLAETGVVAIYFEYKSTSWLPKV